MDLLALLSWTLPLLPPSVSLATSYAFFKVKPRLHLLRGASLQIQWITPPGYRHVPDGVQDTLPPNMAPDMLNILSWRSLSKMAEAGRWLWPSPALLFSPEMGDEKLSCERCPPYTQRKKEHPYLLRQRDPEKNPNKQALLSCPQFTALISYSLTHHIPPWPHTLHQIQYRYM